jgi:hypothetical protein
MQCGKPQPKKGRRVEGGKVRKRQEKIKQNFGTRREKLGSSAL